MFCPECGKPNKPGFSVCKSCGHEIKPLIICPSCGMPNDPSADVCKSCGYVINAQRRNVKSSNFDDNSDEKIQFIRHNKIFHDETETLVDTLGSGFISSLVVQRRFNKSVMFLSNKRIYQRGKLFDKSIQGRITFSHGQSYVDLKEITGVHFRIKDPFYRYFSSLLLFVLGIGAILGTTQIDDIDAQDLLGGIGIVFIILSLISVIVHLLKKPKWLEIEYAGGMIMTNCNWYAKSSIKRFMRNISIAKDNHFQSN